MYLGIVLILVLAYFPFSDKTRQHVRKVVLRTAAVVLTLVATAFTITVGIPSLDTVLNPGRQVQVALLSGVFVEALCLGFWFVAIRCVISVFRRDPPRVDH